MAFRGRSKHDTWSQQIGFRVSRRARLKEEIRTLAMDGNDGGQQIRRLSLPSVAGRRYHTTPRCWLRLICHSANNPRPGRIALWRPPFLAVAQLPINGGLPTTLATSRLVAPSQLVGLQPTGHLPQVGEAMRPRSEVGSQFVAASNADGGGANGLGRSSTSSDAMCV